MVLHLEGTDLFSVADSLYIYCDPLKVKNTPRDDNCMKYMYNKKQNWHYDVKPACSYLRSERFMTIKDDQ